MYQPIKQIGEGTFGKVYKSKIKGSDKVVAVKKIPIDPESGFSFTTIREIKTLKKLKNDHIIELVNVFIEENMVSVVLEYMPYDLTGLLASKYEFSDEAIYSLVFQMIEATYYIHSNGLIHRDIKPSNILLDSSGRLKITDFGLTREASSHMTNRVCTLWYRAPELLLGDTTYSHKVDAWSIACVILELKNGGPVFKGRDEISQVKEIFGKLGAPSVEYPWDSLFDVKKYKKSEPWDQIIESNFGKLLNKDLLHLIKEFLCLDKNRRLSIENSRELSVVKSGGNRLYPLNFTESHEFYTKDKKENEME